MEKKSDSSELFKMLTAKGILKQEVYANTYNTFSKFKTVIKEIVKEYQESDIRPKKPIPFEYKNRGEFEVELKFAGDLLIFMMHTNVFEFPREHEVSKMPYIREDKERSYCGIINIYNFLGDSFKYKRVNDAGYLIGRIFINKDMHYFIEGKREIGFLYQNFGSAIMDAGTARKIIQSSIKYTLNFDKTGKRLGFKFQADQDEEDKFEDTLL
ncbi:MAG: hypothetical protein B6I19_04655 [Bacteroidetes bacterium 4572_114]|nr:MAG: hypothetical protein B6I19_04655 [Bacteroidetes bacterium 4572_114]